MGAIGQVGGGATSASQSGLSQQYPTSFVNAIHAQMKQDGLRVNPDFVDKVGEVNVFFLDFIFGGVFAALCLKI